MTEELTIHHERVDDIPLLLAQLDQMQVANLLDECFPTHGNWDGLSLGQVVSVWLTFILSEANHRMSHVEPWVERRLQTLQTCLDTSIRPLDLSDDRLAAALDYLSDDASWQNFERRLNEHTLRVYDLRPQRVRVDATTAKYFGRMSEDGLFQFGHSKDHRPDLPQLKINLSVLDPLGLPVTTKVVSGNVADDPLYVPEIKQVQASLQGEGLTFIGDAKMASLATRTYVAKSGNYYLCPLPATQVGVEEMEQLLGPVFEQQQELVKVYRQTPDPSTANEQEVIALGYEFAVRCEGRLDAQPVVWQERRLVVRSLAWAEGQAKALDKRINKAEAEIAALNERRQGKKVFREEEELRAAGEKILASARVSGLVKLEYQTTHTKRQLHRYGPRPAGVKIESRVRIEAKVDSQEVEKAKARLGWRVYASNQPATELSLQQAVLAYRQEYMIERGFGRLKGKPLSLTPLYLDTDKRVTGLLRVLIIALRVLCLVEFSVRRELQAKGEKLAGIYPGNPKRATERPTTEMMLRVFEGVTLTRIEQGGQVQVHLTPLTPVQERILQLLRMSPEIYLRLAQHASKLQSSKLLLKMSEP